MAETVDQVSIAKETRKSYLIYALSVITSRALPDVRDGLKPVQRRILYAMYHDLRLHADDRPRKCARIIGEVTGKYHPHGDEAAYDALVRLAQDWVMRMPLVDGQGNFGSVDGDPPAAYRYTEAKLTALADFCWPSCASTPSTCGRPTTPRRKSRSSCPPSSPTCWSTARLASPSAWPPTFRRTTSARCCGPASISSTSPTPRRPQLLDKVKGPDFPLGGKIVTDRADPAQDLRGRHRQHQGAGRMEDRRTRPQDADHHHLDPLRRQQGQPGTVNRRDHRRPQAAAAAQPHQRIQRQGRPAHRPGHQDRRRSATW